MLLSCYHSDEDQQYTFAVAVDTEWRFDFTINSLATNDNIWCYVFHVLNIRGLINPFIRMSF